MLETLKITTVFFLCGVNPGFNYSFEFDRSATCFPRAVS